VDEAARTSGARQSLLLCDGFGDVRLLRARDILQCGAEDAKMIPPAVEYGQVHAALHSTSPAWMSLPSRQVREECTCSMSACAKSNFLWFLLLPAIALHSFVVMVSHHF
jgi:hypothetical protein